MSQGLKETPSQTAGPYLHIGLMPNWAELPGVYPSDLGAAMLEPKTKGERIVLEGKVLDGAGAPVTDAVLEIWQADAEGRFASADFRGWGRQATNSDGDYRFETVKPGKFAGPDGRLMAPQVLVWIVARGINIGLQTRIYFDDEDNSGDWTLQQVPAGRRDTLVSRRMPGPPARYSFDIHLQGDGETVFLDA